MKALVRVHHQRIPRQFVAEVVETALRQQGFDYHLYSGPESPPEDFAADLVVTVGGDGTFLQGAREAWQRDIPVLGVDVGFVGFLCYSSPKTLGEDLSAFRQGSHTLRLCSVLEAKVLRGEKQVASSIAINDLVVSKAEISRLTNLPVSVDGVFLTTYRADGVIVSTALGSTAYSMSAGGPILEPGLHLVMITPICSHSLAVRPLVLHERATITIEVPAEERNVAATFDGQLVEQLEPGDLVEAHLAQRYLRMVIPPGRDYIRQLRTKLRWGQSLLQEGLKTNLRL